MKEIYVDYVDYNLWANRRMIETFSTLPDEQLVATIVSSFPSVQKTFLHIWDAETLWLKRLKGISPTEIPSKAFVGDNAAVFSNLLNASQSFLEFVEAQPELFFEKSMFFRTISYGEQTQKAYEMIHHCMNHSTMHRGQLIMMGRQLGIEKFPPTDFGFFLRGKAK